MVIDINKESVINTLSSIDVGEGGHVALVTFDGTEFYADGTSKIRILFLQVPLSIRMQ